MLKVHKYHLNFFQIPILQRKESKILNKIPILNSSNVSDYMSLINNLPENDDPEMFGLPLNVDRSVQRYISSQVLLKLNSIFAISSECNPAALTTTFVS